MSRFMLNLQAVNNRTLRGDVGSYADTEDSRFWRNSSIIFERVIGSLGSTVLDDSGSHPADEDSDGEVPIELERKQSVPSTREEVTVQKTGSRIEEEARTSTA